MTPEKILDDWLKAMPLGDGSTARTNEAGIVYIDVDGEYSIGIAVNRETRTLGFVCFLLPAPDAQSGALLHHILTLNLALLALRNAALGIDVESGMVVLGRMVPMDGLDAQSFAQFLADTAKMATSTRNNLRDYSKQAPAAAAADLEKDIGTNWIKL